MLLERFDKLYRPKGVVEHTGVLGIDEYLKRKAHEVLVEEAEAEQAKVAAETQVDAEAGWSACAPP